VALGLLEVTSLGGDDGEVGAGFGEAGAMLEGEAEAGLGRIQIPARQVPGARDIV
jgi:hypothetical protein